MFYLHIPKTGGQTLSRRLASAFPPERTHLQIGQFTYPQDSAAFDACLAANDFVEAHVTGQLLRGRQVEDVLVTVRDPVDQIISHFRHIRREPDRPLSRAARRLDPGTFFDHFGDFFANHQSRYLLSAFLPLAIEEQRHGFWPTVARHLPAVLERVRWLVPTDQINAFIPLWETQTGRLVAERDFATNHAPRDDVDLATLRTAISARPALFALDNVLYQYACERYAEWASQVRQTVSPWDFPSNASRVFDEEGSGIWLRRGWYPSEPTAIGRGNWAGPSARSDLVLRREPQQDILAFHVLGVNGITYSDICAFAAESFTALPVQCEEVGPNRWRYRIDVSGQPEICDIALVVPDCLAPIIVFPDGGSDDLNRRSFLAAGWQLESKATVVTATEEHSAA